MWSFLHIEDAAEATPAAVERGQRGIYNIVDADPAVAQWLPAMAIALNASAPCVPRWLVRALAGEAVRGCSSAMDLQPWAEPLQRLDPWAQLG